MLKQRVICAMSGGVDSSVAAAILKKQGYEVIGIFMKLWSAETTGDKTENICCSTEAATAARAVANKLKIPFYVVNFAEEFKKAVVDYYIKESESGRTPNPCVVCNREIKGELLMQKMLEMDADYLATGHYARIKIQNSKFKSQNFNKFSPSNDKSKCKNIYELHQGRDLNKDQTYFLWTLTQKHLAKLLFPIGDYTKIEVRQMAKKWQLPTAKRQESQGICFIPDRDVSRFLRRQAAKLTKPGPIYDKEGKKLGRHHGLVDYTIGQREGLGIGGPRAYYVLKLNRRDNSLIVGEEKDLYLKELIAEDLNWLNLTDNRQLTANHLGAKIRYGHPVAGCRLSFISQDRVKVIFDQPQRAITPGQSIVFYAGEEVLGGGVIKEGIENN
jgi:tRNA-specific 2-thiouridylase